MPKIKNLAIIGLVVVAFATTVLVLKLYTSRPSLETNNTAISISASTPPANWLIYKTDNFSIYYPKDRQEKHVLDKEDHDGFALCSQNTNCSQSEVSVYPTDFVSPDAWLSQYKEVNLKNNYPEKYFIVIYPNFTLNKNSGIGSIIIPANKYDKSNPQLDTAVIEHGNKTYGITYDSTNSLDIQILSTLKFKN